MCIFKYFFLLVYHRCPPKIPRMVGCLRTLNIRQKPAGCCKVAAIGQPFGEFLARLKTLLLSLTNHLFIFYIFQTENQLPSNLSKSQLQVFANKIDNRHTISGTAAPKIFWQATSALRNIELIRLLNIDNESSVIGEL